MQLNFIYIFITLYFKNSIIKFNESNHSLVMIGILKFKKILLTKNI